MISCLITFLGYFISGLMGAAIATLQMRLNINKIVKKEIERQIFSDWTMKDEN